MNVFKEFISSPQRSEYRKVLKYNSMLTREQALEDLDDFQYIMNNCYCGKDYFERQGINFEACYSKLKEWVFNNESIYVSDYCRTMHKVFDIGIVDNHLSFASPLTGRLHFGRNFSAYFSDILVEKKNKKYFVIQSSVENVKVGSLIKDTGCFFKTLSPIGKEYFLIGLRSWEPCKEMTIYVNDYTEKVPLHRCRANSKTKDYDICLNERRIQGIVVIRSNCCDYVGGLKKDDPYIIGRKYSDTDLIIWNNLSNEGGYSNIPREFINGLNGYSHCEEYCAKLISPITEGKDCMREYVLSEAVPYDKSKAKYNGTLYFLMNSGTASSGETSVLYAKSLKNVVFIGENTMGCNTFGNVASYKLPHSGIVLRVPNVINLCSNPNDCVEGKGFTPDYWVDSVNIQEEVIDWIHKKIEQF